MSKIFGPAFFVLASVPALPVLAAGNLLANPGFEQGSGGNPQNWGFQGAAGAGAYNTGGGPNVHAGSNSVSINEAAATQIDWWSQTVGAIVPGASYDALVWVKVDSISAVTGANGVQIEVQFFTSVGNAAGGALHSAVLQAPTGGWVSLATTVVAPPSAATMEFRCEAKRGIALVHFDDAVFQVSVPSPTGTATPADSPSPSLSATRTDSRTATESGTRTATRTGTATASRTSTATASGTASVTETATATETDTETATATESATRTPTATVSSTSTVSGTRTISSTASLSPTVGGPSNTSTATRTASGTRTRTETATVTESATPSETVTRSASTTSTATPTDSRTRTETATATDTRTPTDSSTATATFSETATTTATRSPSATVSATRTWSATASLTETISQTATISPTPDFSDPSANRKVAAPGGDVAPGGVIQYSITIGNLGGDAYGVDLVDSIPTWLDFARMTPVSYPQPVMTPPDVRWHWNVVQSGQFVVALFDVPVRNDAPNGALIVNAATILLQGTPVGQISPVTNRVVIPTRIEVSSQSLLPKNVAAGQVGVAALRLRIANTIRAGARNAEIASVSFTLEDKAGAPIAPGSALSGARLEDEGGQTWGTLAAVPAANPWMVALSTPMPIGAGGTADLTLKLDLSNASTASSIAVSVADSASLPALDSLSQSSISVGPAPGSSFPMRSGYAVFTKAGFESSFGAFPNPMRPGAGGAVFRYFLESEGRVTLRVWTRRGQSVATILNRVSRSAGLHLDAVWDGRNGAGQVVQPGVYVARLTWEPAAGGTRTTSTNVVVLP